MAIDEWLVCPQKKSAARLQKILHKGFQNQQGLKKNSLAGLQKLKLASMVFGIGLSLAKLFFEGIVGLGSLFCNRGYMQINL